MASLVAAAAALLVTGCLGPPQRAPRGSPAYLSVRFDSARNLHVTSNLLALDPTPGIIEDVVGVGGRVTAYRQDTLLIEPYYITMYDAAREDRERTFYRGGAYPLPDLAIVESGAGMVVSDFTFPPRASQDLQNVFEFAVRILPVLLLLSFVHGAGHL